MYVDADFHRAMVASAPGRITPHRAPPYEELDLGHEFAHLFTGKSTKNAAIRRAALFDSSMHQIVCRLGLCPRPHWWSLQRSPKPPRWV